MRRMNAPCFGMVLLFCAGCARDEEGQSSAAPATPTPAGFVKLSDAAQRQLGVASQRPVKREVQAVMPLTGWLELPPGREVVVKSPLTGYLAASEDEPEWTLGARVEQKQKMQRVMAFLSPAELAQLIVAKKETDITIKQSLVSMTLAKERLDLANAAKEAVSAVRRNELQEIYERSKVAFEESKGKLPFLPREPYDDELLMRPVTITSPISGRLRELHVRAPQFVFQGDPMWTVANWSVLWVRVPVFETDVSRVLTIAAGLHVSGRSPIPATPLEAPQPTKPGLRTVDLLYAVPNETETLRPGQSVTVDLPIGRSEDGLLIARSAVLWDGNGSAWVYVRATEDSFRRQRVELGQTVGEEVVIARGLDADDDVVTTAAQALYGEEFKGAMPAEDD